MTPPHSEDRKEPARIAAASFHAFVCDSLGCAVDQPGVQKTICEMLDEDPARYSEGIRGRVITLERVLLWIRTWNGLGRGPKVELQTDGSVVRLLEQEVVDVGGVVG